jgi:hypothetical protein
MARDLFVIDQVRRRGLPLAAVIGGGYGPDHDQVGVRHATIHKAMVGYLNEG